MSTLVDQELEGSASEEILQSAKKELTSLGLYLTVAEPSAYCPRGPGVFKFYNFSVEVSGSNGSCRVEVSV